jgi:hypothetical protein
MTSDPQPHRPVADAAWRWVLDQVQWDDTGPWVPVSATAPPAAGPAWDRDGMHSGVGGLALVLAEIRLDRPWTSEEQRLADGIAARVRSGVPDQVDCTYFDGLVSGLGALVALGAPGADAVVARLTELASPDGWPQTVVGPPRFTSDARVNDLTLGTAGVLLGALWAHRHGVDGADALAGHAAAVLLAEGEPLPTGTSWEMVPPRFGSEPGNAQMPNLSHGTAGVATALALAGAELDRPDLVAAAASGAEHLVSLGDVTAHGFVVPRYLPRDFNDQDEVTHTWCHGGAGTSLLFVALEHAGAGAVAGEPPASWSRRCRHSVRTSGLPARLHPGFWDNDGRCCGTAGVGEVFLDAWRRGGDERDLAFARHLADTLVDRALRDGPHACWRFLEHHAEDPLLPPGVGWMQGAAGIAGYLFRAARVLEGGRTAPVASRMDSWWADGTTAWSPDR